MNSTWMIARFLVAVSLLTGLAIGLGCQAQLELTGLVSFSGGDDKDAERRQPPHGKTEKSTEKAEDLIKDWDKPIFALFVSGRQSGYIEPCGCTGLDNQKGGLIRRHVVQKILRNRNWDLVSIDAGNQIDRFGQQPVIKLRWTYQGLCKVMDYQFIGIGPDDLKTPAIDLAQAMMDNSGSRNPFTCANVVVLDESVTNRYSIVKKNGKKIGITHVLGDEYLGKFAANPSLTTTSAAAALADVVPRIQSENCDLKVLVAQTSLENCRNLAKQFPVFDVLIAAAKLGDPTMLPEEVRTGNHITRLIQVGVKGMYVGVVGYYEAPKKQIKYKRVPLESRYKDDSSPEMKKIFKSYQEELKTLILNGALEDIKPRLHPSGNKFVGSEVCAECHDEEFEIWEDGLDGNGGPHEEATRSLTDPGERTWVQRHYDPECLSCHVTGWHPQDFYPYQTGYLDHDADEHLHANGCENCHGPGSAHVEAERNPKKVGKAELARLQKQMFVSVKEAEDKMCMQCHDLDNSPDFLKDGAFAKYWAKIEH